MYINCMYIYIHIYCIMYVYMCVCFTMRDNSVTPYTQICGVKSDACLPTVLPSYLPLKTWSRSHVRSLKTWPTQCNNLP